MNQRVERSKPLRPSHRGYLCVLYGFQTKYQLHLYTALSDRLLYQRRSVRTALLGCTQRVVVIPYQSFRTTSRRHLKASRIHLQGPRLDSWRLEMGLIGCAETSVSNCYYTLRNNPEDRSSHPLNGGSLKSRRYKMKLQLQFRLTRVFKKLNIQTSKTTNIYAVQQDTQCGLNE